MARRPALLADPRLVRCLAPLLVGLVLLGGWEVLCRAYAVPAYIFPRPSAIAASLRDNLPALSRALLGTLAVTVEAFAVSVVIGVLVAFLFVQSRVIELSLFPYAILLQVTPVVAVAPLIIILVKNTNLALTACAALMAVFPIISNTTIGLRSVDPGLLAYFRMNKIGRLQTLFRLRVPSALPFFLAGLRISIGLALIGAVVAEFVAGTGGRSAGLAYEILQSGFQLDIPRMFAALLLITATGIVLFAGMVGLERLCLRHWHDIATEQDR